MPTVQLTDVQVNNEIARISEFMIKNLNHDIPDKVVIGVSGGVDSDVVTRLAVKALGPERIKLFVVLQEQMDPKHLDNARALAKDVNIALAEIDLVELPFMFVRALNVADKAERFRPDGLIDPSRAKCSVRTVILSTYLDRGYIVLGASNRTEYEMGFFLPLGDGLGHLKPIVHLYKTQVYQLARALGTLEPVITQPASSGFWIGAQDLEDMSFWLYHEAPIAEEISFSLDDVAAVGKIRAYLTTENVDMALMGLARGFDDAAVGKLADLPVEIVARIRKVNAAAQRFKRRPLGVRLENLS